MNYCTNCGKKLDQNTKFCTNCGQKIENAVVKQNKPEVKKEFNVNNLILYVGVSLVILATFIFAICTWDNMSGLFKISFLTFESLLFFVISFTFAKIKNNGLSKAFYLMAVLMIPIILYTIPVYGLLGDYLSYKGAGIFVYLAISNAICAVIYLLSYFLISFKPFAYIAYAFIYAFIVNIFFIFEYSMQFYLIASLVFVLLVIIINLINHKENYFRKSLTRFTSIFYIVFSVFLTFAIYGSFGPSYITGFNSINIYLILITVLFFVNTFVFIYQYRKSAFTYASPFLIMPVVFSVVAVTVYNATIAVNLIAGTALVVYLIYLLFKNNYLKITSKIIAYLYIYFFIFIILLAMITSAEYYLALAILGLIALIFNIVNSLTEKNRIMSDILIPLSSFFIVLGLVKAFAYLPNIFVMLLISSVYLTIYMIFKAFDKKTNKIYFGFALGTLIISFFMCNYMTSGIYILFLNLLLLILFIFVTFMEKSSGLNITTFVILALSILKIRFILDIDARIVFACIALVAIAVGIILNSSKKVLSKFYLFFGQILTLILTLCAFAYSTYIIIALISVLFVVSFISLILYNNYKGYRILSEMFGMLLIFNIVNYLVAVPIISTLITLFIYMVILVILGLTNKEKGGTIIILSTMSLIPYYNFLLMTYTGIGNQLAILPFIVYLFVIAFFFKMKYDTRMHIIIWPLIVFSLIAINTSTIGIIFSLALALTYIFIGIFKKYQYLVTFGIVYILVIIVFEIFTLFDNLALLIAVLVVGIALILYVVINEVYRSKKNK